MKDKIEFYGFLVEVDGADVSGLNRLPGDYDFNRFFIKVNPFLPDTEETRLPVVVRLHHAVSGFPERLLSAPIRRTALEDFLARKLAAALEKIASFDASGLARRQFAAPAPGQKILPRTTVTVADEHTDVLLQILVPMRDGRIDGTALQAIFFDALPLIVQQALLFCNMDERETNTFVEVMEDAEHIRQSLMTENLVAFIGEGSMTDRQPGSDRPDYESARALAIDPAAQRIINVPHRGTITGLGIPSGITLILGDALAGRTELMHALAAGIYNHIPGDGREFVITLPDAVYVAAEPGRSVQRVDIGCFVADGEDYSTTNADALRSQAAAIIEALEAGARVLLLDEVDSAPGFISCDDRLAPLLGTPSSLTTLAARARQLAEELGISTIIGGQADVGPLIPVADTILRLVGGVLTDATDEVKAAWAGKAPPAPAYDFTRLIETARWIIPSSIDASVGRRDGVIHAPSADTIQFGRYTIDVAATHQVADAQQALTLGLVIEYMRQRYLDTPRPLREALDLVERDLGTEGLDHITRDPRSDLARPRRYEVAAALNRLASLRVARAAL